MSPVPTGCACLYAWVKTWGRACVFNHLPHVCHTLSSWHPSSCSLTTAYLGIKAMCDTGSSGSPGMNPCPMVLVFGCRQSKIDHIYREETLQAKNKGVFRELYTAYSREPDRPKVSQAHPVCVHECTYECQYTHNRPKVSRPHPVCMHECACTWQNTCDRSQVSQPPLATPSVHTEFYFPLETL